MCFRLIEGIDYQSSGRQQEGSTHKMESKMNHMHYSYGVAIYDKLTREFSIFYRLDCVCKTSWRPSSTSIWNR